MGDKAGNQEDAEEEVEADLAKVWVEGTTLPHSFVWVQEALEVLEALQDLVASSKSLVNKWEDQEWDEEEVEAEGAGKEAKEAKGIVENKRLNYVKGLL